MTTLTAAVERAVALLAGHTTLVHPGQPPEAIAATLRARLGRYWPSSGIESTEAHARHPDREQTVVRAREVTEGRIRFGQPWHMEQTHASEPLAQPIRWYATPNGDHEWAHALVRFTHMMDLAIAARLTADATFVQAYRQHLHEFFAARLAPSALWRNHLDAALRINNLVRSYDLLRDHPEFQPANHVVLAALVLMDATEVERGIGRRETNWEFFLASALACAGRFLGNLGDTVAWRARASHRLQELVAQQLAPDGVQLEQAPMYHGQCALALLDALVMQRAAGEPFDATIVTAVHRMVEVLQRIADPEGRIPPIGDSDAFNVDYVVGYRDAVLGPPPAVTPGNDGAVDAPMGASIDYLPDTGWTIVRWPERGAARGYVLFDASGRPAAERAGHSHADDLQLLLHAGGHALLVDPGRFTYESLFLAELRWLPWRVRHSHAFRQLYALARPRFRGLVERDWREYFRSTARHNTVSCDNQDQPGYHGLASGAPATITGRVARADGKRVTCAATATYAHYAHTREVLISWPHELVVVDRLVAAEPHVWSAWWHLGPACAAERTDDARVLVTAGHGVRHTFEFREANGVPLQIEIVDDWVSTVYNRKIPAQTIRARTAACASASVVTTIALGAAVP